MMASPAPSIKRTAIKTKMALAAVEETVAVSAVKTPHHTTPAARTEEVGHPAARSLKKRVAHQKCAKYPAELHGSEMKFLGNGRAGDGNVGAIEKCYCT